MKDTDNSFLVCGGIVFTRTRRIYYTLCDSSGLVRKIIRRYLGSQGYNYYVLIFQDFYGLRLNLKFQISSKGM